MSWSNFPTTLTTDQISSLVDESARALGGLPLATLRDRNALAQKAEQAVQAQVLAKVGVWAFSTPCVWPPAI